MADDAVPGVWTGGAMSIVWRSTGPTVEESMRCRWWWVRWPGVEPHPFDSAQFGPSLRRWQPHPEAEWAPCPVPAARST